MISTYLQRLLNEKVILSQKVKNNLWKGVLTIYKNPSLDELVELEHSLSSDFNDINVGVDNEANIYLWRSEVLDDEVEKAKHLGMAWSMVYDTDKKILKHYCN